MHPIDLTKCHELLANKKISSSELVQETIKSLKEVNETLNCMIHFSEALAYEQANLADKIIQAKKAGPLTGIPIVHKDVFCTRGTPTTAASKMLEHFKAQYNATIVQKLEDAGMPMVGKANMDEFAMGATNTNSYYGPCKNPWDINRIPGGSSGGSAALVATGIVAAATGSDTGGSIRQPAAHCGISGLKPTYGRISRHGMISYASSLDTPGFLARTARDLALLLSNSAGKCAFDSTSSHQAVPNYVNALENNIQNLRIGLPRNVFNEHLDPQIKAKILETAQILEKLGAKIIDIDLPHMKHAIPCYYTLASAECASNLSRYDGIRYGYHSNTSKSLEKSYKTSRSKGFGDEVKRRILAGTFVLSHEHYDIYYMKAQKIRRMIQNDFLQAFKLVDIILAPTTPTTAWPFDDTTTPTSTVFADIYTTAANLSGMPAMSMPIGHLDMLPVGGQLISSAFNETLLLNVAHQFQKETSFHQTMPMGI